MTEPRPPGISTVEHESVNHDGIGRVAVTTTAETAWRYIGPLQAVGLEPVSLPCIDVMAGSEEALDRLRNAADRAEWLLLTSPRAVRVVWGDRGMPPVSSAVVGPSTGAAVEAHGGIVGLVGSGGAMAIAELLLATVRRRPITAVFPHARDADPHTAQTLRAGGVTVVADVAYGTRSIAPDHAHPVDSVIFGSPSAVDGWCRSRDLDDLLIATIGPTTAAAVRRHGGVVDVVPARPDPAAVVAEIAARLPTRSASNSEKEANAGPVAHPTGSPDSMNEWRK